VLIRPRVHLPKCRSDYRCKKACPCRANIVGPHCLMIPCDLSPVGGTFEIELVRNASQTTENTNGRAEEAAREVQQREDSSMQLVNLQRRKACGEVPRCACTPCTCSPRRRWSCLCLASTAVPAHMRHKFSPCICTPCDIVPLYVLLQTIYLSSNNLSSLDGLQQFTNLRTLSIADNKLHRFSCLHPLQSCPSLGNLNLQNNPICKLPFYRWGSPFFCE
jgi:hypothetical protein